MRQLWERVYGPQAAFCASCQEVAPDLGRCLTCEVGPPPQPLPETKDAWDLFTACSSQMRSCGFGVTGLDYPALYQTADLFGIGLDRLAMNQIRLLESWTVAQINKADDKDQT